MVVSYINEVAKLDTEIASVLTRKPIVPPQGSASDINKMTMGKIEIDNWTMMFNRGSEACGDFRKFLFALPYKHLFSTTCLNYVPNIMSHCTLNDATAKKSFSDMIRWYITFHSTLLSIMPKLFKTTKKTRK